MKKLALALLLGFGVSAGAHAAFGTGGFCTLGTQTNGISLSNMTLNGNDASDCFGTVDIGGDVQNEMANINALGWGTYTNTQFIKDDAQGGVTASFLGMNWTLTADNDLSIGTYTLTVTDTDPFALPNLPMTVDIVGFLKAGTPGAFYLFNDAVIDTSNAGTFSIVWTVGNKGNNPGLSGLSLFIGEPSSPPPPPPGELPEPGSLALLGLALAGLGAMRRRFV